MTILNFPNSGLTVGQIYNAPNGVTYSYDGTRWIGQTVTTASILTFNSVITQSTTGLKAENPSNYNQYTLYTWNGIAQPAASTGWGISTGNGSGTLTFDNSGNLTVNGNITAYYSSSDRRLKENINEITGALDIVISLTGVTYDWTEDYLSKIPASASKSDIGLIAQDVQKIVPDVVYDKGDGYLAIRYEKLVPLLIEAVKEQKQTIDQLTSDVALLKSRLGI
jgi:hypothetical protein